MPEYMIDVAQVEQLQMISDTNELERIFTRAKSTIVQGGTVVLSRKSRDGKVERFDEFSTEQDLNTYKKAVYKHL